MKDNNTTHITFGFTAIQNRMGESSTNADLLARIPLPSAIYPENIETMCRDCELFAAKLRKNPEMFGKLVETLNHGKLKEAGAIARAMGLAEEQITREGGGLMWLLIGAIVVAGVLYAGDAF